MRYSKLFSLDTELQKKEDFISWVESNGGNVMVSNVIIGSKNFQRMVRVYVDSLPKEIRSALILKFG